MVTQLGVGVARDHMSQEATENLDVGNIEITIGNRLSDDAAGRVAQSQTAQVLR